MAASPRRERRTAVKGDLVRLTEASTGASLILQALPQEPGAEGQVRSLGLIPGGRVRLIRRAPFRGPLLVETQGRVVALGWKVACMLLVSPASNPDPDRA